MRVARFLHTLRGMSWPQNNRPKNESPDVSRSDDRRADENDDNDPLVRRAKLTGRVLGYLFVGYLVFALGQQLKFW